MYTVWKFRRNSALSLRRFSTSFSEKKVEAGKPSSFTHPSAIVHPNAIISEGVLIGPFCTVGPSAKLGSGCQLNTGSHVFGNTELGDHCVLMPGAVVGDDIPGRTVMGCNNIVGHYPVVGVKCQDLKYKPSDECFLDVGDNNDIREHSSIHRSSKSSDKTVIGNNNLIMGSCHIAHDCKVGNNNIFANGTLLAGHVVVGDYAHTAGGTAVHQFCHIGSFSFIGGGSMVSQDVPKYTMVSGSRTEPLLKMDVPKYTMVSGSRTELRGLNLEGLRRHGFTSAEITSLRTAYRKIFMTAQEDTRGLDERLAGLEQDELANVPAVRYMLQSIRGSFEVNRRGICKYRHRTS